MSFITVSGRPAGPVGLGTWRLGEDGSKEAVEIAAIRTHIKTGGNHKLLSRSP